MCVLIWSTCRCRRRSLVPSGLPLVSNDTFILIHKCKSTKIYMSLTEKKKSMKNLENTVHGITMHSAISSWW